MKSFLSIIMLSVMFGIVGCALSKTEDSKEQIIHADFPPEQFRKLLGAFIHDGKLVTVTSDEVAVFVEKIYIVKWSLDGELLEAKNFLLKHCDNLNVFSQENQTFLGWTDGSKWGNLQLWVVSLTDDKLRRKMILSEQSQEPLSSEDIPEEMMKLRGYDSSFAALWFWKWWLLDVAGQGKLFVAENGSEWIGKDTFMPTRWICCYRLENDKAIFEGRTRIPDEFVRSDGGAIECAAEGDKVYIWICADSDKIRCNTLKVAEWRTDGPLQWLDCYEGKNPLMDLSVDYRHGSVASVNEEVEYRMFIKRGYAVCQLQSGKPQCVLSEKTFSGVYQVVGTGQDDICWILRFGGTDIVGYDKNFQICKENKSNFANDVIADDVIVIGWTLAQNGSDFYFVALTKYEVKIGKVDEFSDRSLVQRVQQKDDTITPELPPDLVMAAYTEYTNDAGKKLLKASNEQLANDIINGDDDGSAIISYYRLVSRDSSKAELNLRKRLTKICSVDGEPWIIQMQLATYGQPAVKHLLKIVETGTMKQRRTAVSGLAWHPDQDVVNDLLKLLENPEIKKDNMTYISLCEVAIQNGDSKGIDYLIKAATAEFGDKSAQDIENEELRELCRNSLQGMTGQYNDLPDGWSAEKWNSWWNKHRATWTPSQSVRKSEEMTAGIRQSHDLFRQIAGKLEEDQLAK